MRCFAWFTLLSLQWLCLLNAYSAATDNVRWYVAAVPVDELSPQGLANLRGVMSQAQLHMDSLTLQQLAACSCT